MNIYRNINEFKAKEDVVITTGTFDGVHVGHRKIIQRVTELAKKINGESVLLTFFPHPRMVLYPEQNDLRLINTIEERVELLKETGIDHLIIHPFTKEFSRISSLDFVRDILVTKLNTRKLVIGYDHHFGKNREGSFEHLKEYGPVYGFDVEEISAQEIQQINISSTKIRNSVLIGEIKAANQFLGYHYFINGTVVEGEKIGRQIGFPTANLKVNDWYKLIPGNGVYAVKVDFEGGVYNGMLNIGTRPTINGNDVTIEVNIFNFNQEIYTKELKIEFIEKIRDEQKFDNLTDLQKQLTHDKEKALSILS
ncbi:MAG: bifunctional riboflavin kinase/FAD synthetase [Flavobacteriales bacterium]|nr:bifunctional riboflavin kinase/FAD synthetase [Flavobacteriales bacterium]